MFRHRSRLTNRLAREWAVSRRPTVDPHRPRLVIACSDIVMDRAVEQLQSAGPAIVLRRTIPGSRDDLRSEFSDLTDVEAILTRDGVAEIVVCGHSLCSWMPLEAREPLAPAQSGHGLIERVRRRQCINALARQRLVRQLEILRKHPPIARAIASGDLAVEGLFYQDESGAFARFDRYTGGFLVA